MRGDTYPLGEGNLDGDGDDAGSKAAVEGTDKGKRLVVGVDQRDLDTRMHRLEARCDEISP